MIDMDEDALFASLDLIGRTGATGMEFGYLHEGVPIHEADWYAHAQYRGARVIVEHYQGPLEAVEALARRLLTGGTCTHCGGRVTLSDVDRRAGQCRYTRMGREWVRGCAGDQPRERPGARGRRPKAAKPKRKR